MDRWLAVLPVLSSCTCYKRKRGCRSRDFVPVGSLAVECALRRSRDGRLAANARATDNKDSETQTRLATMACRIGNLNNHAAHVAEVAAQVGIQRLDHKRREVLQSSDWCVSRRASSS